MVLASWASNSNMHNYLRKIYVVGQSVGYANWMEGVIVSSLKDADIVVFTGGEDVSPWRYKGNVHPMTKSNPNRDWNEEKAFKEAFDQKKKLVGICRGAQFLCVMAGGSLVQHQLDSNAGHEIETSCGKKFTVNSSHHQAQYPWHLHDDDYKVLAWSENVSPFHFDGLGNELVIDEVEGGKEVEIATYHEIQALCIQPHPEWNFNKMSGCDESRKVILYYRELLNRLLLRKL